MGMNFFPVFAHLILLDSVVSGSTMSLMLSDSGVHAPHVINEHCRQ